MMLACGQAPVHVNLEDTTLKKDDIHFEWSELSIGMLQLKFHIPHPRKVCRLGGSRLCGQIPLPLHQWLCYTFCTRPPFIYNVYCPHPFISLSLSKYGLVAQNICDPNEFSLDTYSRVVGPLPTHILGE